MVFCYHLSTNNSILLLQCITNDLNKPHKTMLGHLI